jgi:arylsulfatase A-like enzyme
MISSHTLSLFKLFILPPVAWGILVMIFLLFRSLSNFTRTGPTIKEEVSKHFSLFAATSLLRQCLWAFSFAFIMAFTGSFSYLLISICWSVKATIVGYSITAGIALFLISAFLFCDQLLHIPSSLQASAQFRFTRLIPLWKQLNSSLLAGAKKAFVCLFCAHLLFAFLLTLMRQDWTLAVVIGCLGSFYSFVYLLYFHVAKIQPVKSVNPNENRPNILMIGCDTLRADRLGHYQYKRNITPAIDQLVHEGVLFSNCYTPLARTAPALASLLTGLWPHNHKIRSNYPDAENLTLPVKSLAQELKEQGYKTATISDWAGGDLGKIKFGFEHTQLPRDQWNIKNFIRQGPAELRLFLTLFTHNRFGKKFLPELYYLAGIPLTQQLGDETKALISDCSAKNSPFFINLFTSTTHVPFGSDYPYYTHFTASDYEGESRFTMTKLSTPEEVINKQKLGEKSFDVEQVINLYDGCVKQFDDQVSKIISHLDKCGLKDNTIIVIYSDHGTDFFETGSWGQGNSLLGDDPSGRIPLVIVDPHQEGGQVVEQTVRSVDFLPTMLDLLSIKPEKKLDGCSLLPLFTAPETTLDLPAFQETGVWMGRVPGMHPDHVHYPEFLDLIDIPNKLSGTLCIKQEYSNLITRAKDRSIRAGQWKLVYIPTTQGIIYELFNTHSDPDCKKECSSTNPAVLTDLKEKLDAWIYSDPLMSKTLSK